MPRSLSFCQRFLRVEGLRRGGGERPPPKPLPDLPPGTAFPGVAVKNVVPFGVFVELEEVRFGFGFGFGLGGRGSGHP